MPAWISGRTCWARNITKVGPIMMLKVGSSVCGTNMQIGQVDTGPGRANTVLGPVDMGLGRAVMEPGQAVTAPGRVDTGLGRAAMGLGRVDTVPGQVVMGLGRVDTELGQVVTAPGLDMMAPGRVHSPIRELLDFHPSMSRIKRWFPGLEIGSISMGDLIFD